MTSHDWDESAPTAGERAAPTPGALFLVVRVADDAVVGASVADFEGAVRDAFYADHMTRDVLHRVFGLRDLEPGGSTLAPEWTDGVTHAGYRLARRAVAL